MSNGCEILSDECGIRSLHHVGRTIIGKECFPACLRYRQLQGPRSIHIVLLTNARVNYQNSYMDIDLVDEQCVD